MQQTIENCLWEYIDDRGSIAKKNPVKKLIETEENWSRKYQELLSIHQLISGSINLEKPSSGFLQKVMNKISDIG